MKKDLSKILLFIFVLFALNINVFADGQEGVQYVCSFGSNRSSGNSLRPGSRTTYECCAGKYTTSIPHITLDVPYVNHFCVSCGTTPCRLCRSNSSSNGHEYIAVPANLSSGNIGGRASISFNGSRGSFILGNWEDSYNFTCEGYTTGSYGNVYVPFQYADTNYESGEADGVCRTYRCEPRALKVCWINDKTEPTQYLWQAVRPGPDWEPNFELTEETCGEDVPRFCFAKFDDANGNQYEWAINKEGWTKLEEITSREDCDEEPLCYKNNQNKFVWGKFKDREGYTLQAGKNRDDCNSIVICDPNTVLNEGNSPSARACEEPVTKTYQTKTSCTSEQNEGFYDINCETKATATFDLGNDKIANSKLSLYNGQGFGFGIKITIVKKCTGVFNKTVWDKAYNTFNSSSVILEDPQRSENVIMKLEGKVDAFSEWQDEDKLDDPTVSLKLLTNPNVEIATMSHEVISEGEFKKSDNGRAKMLASGTRVQDFVYSNEENPKVIIYYPPRVYLDKLTGEITTDEKNAIDGANKVYVGMDAEVGDNYPINITISNFKDNKTITNNKCLIKVIEPKSLYRIIDVTNPFVNSTREMPKNWKSDTRDYSILVDGSTEKGKQRINSYKNNPLFTFDLSKNDIGEIKESNKKIGNDYLGTCTNEDKDSITNKICDVINKK